MGADLNNIVKFQRLSDEHVQFLIYQLLRGLKVTENQDISSTHHQDANCLSISSEAETDVSVLKEVIVLFRR